MSWSGIFPHHSNPYTSPVPTAPSPQLAPCSLSLRWTCGQSYAIMTEDADPKPSPFNYILSFLLVGLAWGFTTPFIRRAAVKYKSPTAETHPSLFDERRSWLSKKFWTVVYSINGLLRTPSYAIPLLCNLTGSVWFFLLVGQAGRSLCYLEGQS